MTKRAILYARVSNDDRDMGGRNLTSQVEMCRHYALQKGWHTVAELPESEKRASGADWDLPQLNKALRMARESLFDVLAVREIDRLARTLAKQLVVEGEFKRLGVSSEHVIGDYDNTAESLLMKNVRAVIAEYERLKTTERMIRGKRREVKRGSVLVGHLVPRDNATHAFHIGHNKNSHNLLLFEREYLDGEFNLLIRQDKCYFGKRM